MNILFTTENGPIKEIYFPTGALEAIERLGNVVYNPKETEFTQEELIAQIRDKDVCITHWGCPAFTEDVLQQANCLKLIAHAAGSVADLVTDGVYKRGIQVCSANTIMAKYVAEGVLAYFLAGLHYIPQQINDVKINRLWHKRTTESRSLFGAKIGLIGLGTIGRFLIELLKPFDVKIKLYDPYIRAESLANYPNVELSSLDETLDWGEIISIHASLTLETRGMLNAEKLRRIKDQALFVNTARAAIVDENALINELRLGRFQAILDVYEKEPLPLDNPLREMDNVLLLPHVAGITAREQMTFAIIEDIQRFCQGQPLQHRISYDRFKMMTKERMS